MADHSGFNKLITLTTNTVTKNTPDIKIEKAGRQTTR